MDRPRTGCLVCGSELLYASAAEAMTCHGCGQIHASAARCSAGHFVCDACHSTGAKDFIERYCRTTASQDPMEIALALMRHPGLKMHGPEHHYLVPAALIAAYYDARGEPDAKPEKLAEAKRRSEPVAGGFCGFQGACGAAVGTGIFVSVVTGATPLSRESWGLANRMTARSLEVVGSIGGPRCCKRTAWLSMLAAVHFAREHLGASWSAHGPACELSALNRECLEVRCPFFRAAA